MIVKIKNPRESQIKSKSTNNIKDIHLTIKLNNQTCNNFKQSQQIQARQNLKGGSQFFRNLGNSCSSNNCRLPGERQTSESTLP